MRKNPIKSLCPINPKSQVRFYNWMIRTDFENNVDMLYDI
jgi:hypothetical protein